MTVHAQDLKHFNPPRDFVPTFRPLPQFDEGDLPPDDEEQEEAIVEDPNAIRDEEEDEDDVPLLQRLFRQKRSITREDTEEEPTQPEVPDTDMPPLEEEREDTGPVPWQLVPPPERPREELPPESSTSGAPSLEDQTLTDKVEGLEGGEGEGEKDPDGEQADEPPGSGDDQDEEGVELAPPPPPKRYYSIYPSHQNRQRAAFPSGRTLRSRVTALIPEEPEKEEKEKED